MKSHVQDIVDFKQPSTKFDSNRAREQYTHTTELANDTEKETCRQKSPRKNDSTDHVNTSNSGKDQPNSGSYTVVQPDSPGHSNEPKKPKLPKQSLSPMRFKIQKKKKFFIKKSAKACERNDVIVKQRKGIRMDKISCKFCHKKVIRDVNKIYDHSLKCANMEKTNKKAFMCCGCDYSSSYLGLLNTHVLTVHSRIEDKPHKCDLCEFRTAYSQSLVIHFRTHTGEKPFECVLCDFKSTTSSSLKSHVKIHHEKKSTREKKIKPFQSASGCQLYCCKYCAFKAKKFGTLNRHMNSQHSQYSNLIYADQNSGSVNEMLQIEMNTESDAESDLAQNSRELSEEKTVFLQFLNLETRSPSKRSLKEGSMENVLNPSQLKSKEASLPSQGQNTDNFV